MGRDSVFFKECMYAPPALAVETGIRRECGQHIFDMCSNRFFDLRLNQRLFLHQGGHLTLSNKDRRIAHFSEQRWKGAAIGKYAGCTGCLRAGVRDNITLHVPAPSNWR
jgi:hypothetical protein